MAVSLVMTRLNGAYNDGYADNLSLTLTPSAPAAVPEPGALALLGLGLVPLGVVARRRRASVR